MQLDESTTRPLIEKIIGLMDTKCVRFNGSAPDWRALFSAHVGDITGCQSAAEFEKGVPQLSHERLILFARRNQSVRLATAQIDANRAALLI